ncbi:cadmium resistance transporter [Gloeothece verrucosa]|uniref:Cadmium resistance transporter n=1 Tax=Gloeothece verrucosa (strain PCC 7822) TaxID=497965 RepID=E0U6C3_GLOV7|nr:cadmium resistance transporter [Gloeothece verrucosa]ADN13566.1 cadmium resistance transporter [Gloeothece verrucosa PCC 7822]
MNWFIEAIIAGVSAFTATNIDDIVILIFFFSQLNASFRIRHILLGQYLGFTGLLIASLVGFFGGLVIAKTWIGLLGFLPIFLGIRQLIQQDNSEEIPQAVSSEATKPSPLSSLLAPQTYSVAAITFANGGDNIAIYVPLFANSSLPELMVIVSVFIILIGVWCAVAYRLTRYPLIARFLTRFGKRLVPFVLIGLGIFILIDSHSYQLLPLFKSDTTR